MYADHREDFVGLGIDDADVVRSGVDHVDLISLAVGCYASGFAADRDGLAQREGAQINLTDCVALAIGDVSVFTVGGAVVRQGLLAEVPPAKTGQDRSQHSDEQEFAQSSDLDRNRSLSKADASSY
jgi:hypothetical protein